MSPPREYNIDAMLTIIGSGQNRHENFLSKHEVGEHCRELFGTQGRNWAALDKPTICNSPKIKPDNLPCATEVYWENVVPPEEAEKILNYLHPRLAQAAQGHGSLVELGRQTQKLARLLYALKTMPLAEFCYALNVELEHGTLNGCDVTNNHPIITALIVSSHLTEDPIYYARLWVMEVSGEIKVNSLCNQNSQELQAELERANAYLACREQLFNQAIGC